jgi:hypothetical protein
LVVKQVAEIWTETGFRIFFGVQTDARPGDAMQSADLTMPRGFVLAFCARQSGDLDAS